MPSPRQERTPAKNASPPSSSNAAPPASPTAPKSTSSASAAPPPPPLILNDCVIPAANLLGEVGKGHHIAFNILNVGRYKLGNAVLGGAKMSIRNAIQYAKERKAFGKSISEFGLIQEKLADMATGIYVAEALIYRTVGLIDQALAAIDKNDTAAIQKAIEEYAVECSIVKVFSSEMLDLVVDETVQIFAGYGYVEEYPAERAYRDARINRIFEGTNEINRLIITGMLMKSAMSGKLALMPAIKIHHGRGHVRPLRKGRSRRPARRRVRSPRLRQEAHPLRRRRRHPEVHAGDRRRAGGHGRHRRHDHRRLRHGIRHPPRRKNRRSRRNAIPVAMARIYAAEAIETIERSARKVIAAVAEGDMARTQFAILRRLAKHDPADTITLRRQVAAHVLSAGKYAL